MRKTTKRMKGVEGMRWLGGALVAAVLLGASAARAQEGPRAGSPRMIGARSVEEIVGADENDLPAVLRRVVAPSLRDELGAPGLSELVARLRSDVGEGETGGLRPVGPHALAMSFRAPTGEVWVQIGVEEEPPHRITSLTWDAPSSDGPEQAAREGGFSTVDDLGEDFLARLSARDFRGIFERHMLAGFQERYGAGETAVLLDELRGGLGEPPEGGYPVVYLDVDGDDLYLTTRNRDGDAMRVLLLPGDGPPFRLRGFDTRAAPAGPREALAPSEWPDAIREFLDGRAADGDFSGAVLVARHGEPIFAEGWGFADPDRSRRITPETPINVGSMNKMFTGLAIAQLEARGMLSYDDSVGEHLPDYPNERVRRHVTIHQLLTHTSGIPSYWNDAYRAGRDTLDTLEEVAATFAEEPLGFEPGTEWAYSNGGPVVLGLILERLTGETYYDYVREHIYEPAGMGRTGHFRKGDDRLGKAVGFISSPRDGSLMPNTDQLGLRGSPAGGGYATVTDLMRFAEALSDGRLLDPENVARMWNPPRPGAEEAGYGYLWGTGEAGGMRWVGHNGGGPGVSADFRYFPESGYVIAVLGNLSGSAGPVSDWLTDLVTRGG